jgi:ADP-heptose:LPS heptosyltransferase
LLEFPLTSIRDIRKDLKPIELLDLEFSSGGMGDSIARLPVVRYILNKYPHIRRIRLFAQDYFKEVAEAVLDPAKVTFIRKSDQEEELKQRPSTHGMHTRPVHHTTLRSHLTHHAFMALADEVPFSPEAYNYLQFDLKKLPTTKNILAPKYVVITTGFTSETREWLPSEVNKVCEWLVQNKAVPVFLGKASSSYFQKAKPTEAHFSDGINYSLGVDLRDATTLLEAAAIMSKAQAVVGVDNGLIHLAAMSGPNLPIVCGYTTVDPQHRMPIRNGIVGHRLWDITSRAGCAPCQTKANFLYNFDFRTCYYGDFACLKDMKGEKFIEALERVMVKRP